MRRMLVLAAAAALAGCGETAQPRPVATPAGPSGTLFLAGREPGTLIRVDTAAGTARLHDVPQLGGGDPPFMVAFTGGRVVTFALGRTHSLAPDLTDPRDLGEAWFFVPSATPGRVWNILLKPRTNFRFRGVREMSVDGRSTFARHARVPGWPLLATHQGLVIQRANLRIWDPATERVRRIPGAFPLAARGSLIATCAHLCPVVHLFDTATRRDRIIRGAAFAESYEGAFSPDGRYVATLAKGRRVAVIDVAAREAQVVEGVRTARDYPLLAWSSSGWLFYNAGDGRLGAWRPGEQARLLGVKVGAFVDMAAD